MEDDVAILSVLGVLIWKVRGSKLGAGKYQEYCDNLRTKLTSGTLKVRAVEQEMDPLERVVRRSRDKY